jgi:hypothetical protein
MAQVAAIYLIYIAEALAMVEGRGGVGGCAFALVVYTGIFFAYPERVIVG